MKKSILATSVVVLLANSWAFADAPKASKPIEEQSTMMLSLKAVGKAMTVIGFCGGEASAVAVSAAADTIPGASALWKGGAYLTEKSFDLDIDWQYALDSISDWQNIFGNTVSMAAGIASLIEDAIAMIFDYGIDGVLDEPFEYTKANYAVTTELFKHMFSKESACGKDAQILVDIVHELNYRAQK